MEPLTGREKTLLAVTLATILVAATVLLIATHRIHNVGRIRAIGLEVYVDQECTEPCDYIDWGKFDPGQAKIVTVYVLNSKTASFTVSCNTSDWNPAEIEEYMSLTFSYEPQVVEPSDVASLNLRLHVDSQIPEGFEEFSFDIYVIATEYVPEQPG